MTSLQLRKERPEDRGISEEARRAIANYNGPITVCPPCTHAIDFAEQEIARRNSGKNGWMQTKERSHRARERRKKFERAAAKAKAKPKGSKMAIADNAERDAAWLKFLGEWRFTAELRDFGSVSETTVKTWLYQMRDKGLIERRREHGNSPVQWRAKSEGQV